MGDANTITHVCVQTLGGNESVSLLWRAKQGHRGNSFSGLPDMLYWMHACTIKRMLPVTPFSICLSFCLSLLVHIDVFMSGILPYQTPDTLYHSASETCRQNVSASLCAMWFDSIILSVHTHKHTPPHTYTQMSVLLLDHTDLIRDSLNSLTRCDLASCR